MALDAWTDQEIEELRHAWNELGKSATECAIYLYDRLRVHRSRSAICGFIKRKRNLFHPRDLFLAAQREKGGEKQNLHAGNIRGKKLGRTLDPGFREPPKQKVDDCAPHVYDAAGLHLPLAALKDGQCRFPVNEAAGPDGHLFCGMPTARLRYCGHHAARAFGGYRAEPLSPPIRTRVDRVFA